MKTKFWLLGIAATLLTACDTPPSYGPGAGQTVYSWPAPTPSSYATSSSTVSRPVTRTYRETSVRYEPPDAQLLYQKGNCCGNSSTAWTTHIQTRGPVTEEVYIGNQRVQSNQQLYRPRSADGVLQPGYVPNGTSGVYDPQTGRLIPVKRP